jgi:uncharacterized protein YbbC (DUF1343 family)
MLCGLDELIGGHYPSLRRRLRSARVGVLTHAAAVDRRGRGSVVVLDELGVRASVLFSPEHGFDGCAQAEEAVASPGHSGDRPSVAPLVSLYGADRDSLSPPADLLAELDVLLVDLVDVGSRYYTYVWTALLAARMARQNDIHTIVLDRPNPLSGDPATLEGRPQQAGFLSFVGLEPIPVRHALTIGEVLARLLAQDGAPLGPDGALSIVPTRGWERHRTAAAWDRPFIPPSPNMPTLETALVYPGGCLVEGTNLSEGRGTTLPFQTVGAPFLDGVALAADLQEAGTPGALVRPTTFRPQFDKHANQSCSGVMLHVTNAALFRPVATYLRLLVLAQRQAPDHFAFRTEPYEFESDTPAFDLLTGSAEARQAIRDGASPEEVVELVAPVPQPWTDVVREAEAGLTGALAN